MSRTRLRKGIFAVAAAAAVGAGALSLAPLVSNASSHREAPLTAADPQIDSTDLYAFVSPDRPNTVSLISSWYPFQEPAGGPNFYQWAQNTNYDIHIDNNGDALPDITYRWQFTTHVRNGNTFLNNTGQVTSLNDTDLNVYQTYDLWRINDGQKRLLLNDAKVAPSNVGDASMPHYNSDLFDAATTQIGGHTNPAYSWVGQSDDSFFLDLRVFDLLYGTNLSETGTDTLAGFSVNTMALQVPKGQLRGPDDGVIGIWTTASRPNMRVETNTGTQTFSGHNVQVSRLGNPLVNEVVVPVGSKDYFNASQPKNDAQFLPAVQDPELPHLIAGVYPGAFPSGPPDSDPNTPGIQRSDLIGVFLTGLPGLNQPTNVTPAEMLRLNMDIPPCTSSCSTLGALGGDTAGFPNGRRLTDDTIDIALRVTMGALLPNHDPFADQIGDGVNQNDVPFNSSFPYVAYPQSGSDPDPHVGD
ncbi:MAG: hypothetical protein QOI81_444 [Actinomycetota bacterium]|nr:hypothetical protein [Actinomycetota bacterium]